MQPNEALRRVLNELEANSTDREGWKRCVRELQRSVPALEDEPTLDALEEAWTWFHIAASSELAEETGEIRQTLALVDDEPSTVWIVDGQIRPEPDTRENVVEHARLPDVPMDWANDVMGALFPGEWGIHTTGDGSVCRYWEIVREVDDPTRQLLGEQLGEDLLWELDASDGDDVIGEEVGIPQPPVFTHLVNLILLIGLRQARPVPLVGAELDETGRAALWSRIRASLEKRLPAAAAHELDALESWMTAPAGDGVETLDLDGGEVWRVAQRQGSAHRVHLVHRSRLGTRELGDDDEPPAIAPAGVELANRVARCIFPSPKDIDVTCEEDRLVVAHGPDPWRDGWWLGYALLVLLRRERSLPHVDAETFVGALLDAEVARREPGYLAALDDALTPKDPFGARCVVVIDDDGYRDAVALEVVDSAPAFPRQVAARDVDEPAGRWVAVDSGPVTEQVVEHRVRMAPKGLNPLGAFVLRVDPLDPELVRALVVYLRAHLPVTFMPQPRGHARWYDDRRWRPMLQSLSASALSRLTLRALRSHVHVVPEQARPLASELLDRLEASLRDGSVPELASSMVEDPRTYELMVAGMGGYLALAVIFAIDRHLAELGMGAHSLFDRLTQGKASIEHVSRWIALLPDEEIER